MEQKYHISRLHICNFRPFVYRKNSKKPYVTIEFDNEDKKGQSMILSGPNGYGKTSIFQAIYFALTGDIDPGDYVNSRRKIQEHLIINDLEKCCFVVVEFKDMTGKTISLIRYAKKGIPSAIKKNDAEAEDFKAYIIEGSFDLDEFDPQKLVEKRREDIARQFGEKNILEWIRRNYIQQEEKGLILRADKDRVNFLNSLIDKDADDYFSEIKVLSAGLKQDIETCENEIKDLVQKLNFEMKEIHGEEPACKKVYPEYEFIWDKDAYSEKEPFQEYVERARRVLEIASKMPIYAYKRKVDILEELKECEPVYRGYVLNLYENNKISAYKNSFYKKQYLQKILEEEKALWEEKLDEEYLTAEIIVKINKIRKNRQEYISSSNVRQSLYDRIEELRKNIAGHEEEIEDIFNKQCPFCGTGFDDKNISLAQAIAQTESIFEDAYKILDNVLEEKKRSWKEELVELKIQIEQYIKEEVAEKNTFEEIQNKEDMLKTIHDLEKKLTELYILDDSKELTIFLDKEKFGQCYNGINEYEEATIALKAIIDEVSKSTSDSVFRQEYLEKEFDAIAYDENKNLIADLFKTEPRIELLKEKINYLEWKKKEKLAREYLSNKRLYETKIEDIRKLYEKEKKIEKVLACQESARKEYLSNIMRYLEIPLYIYSGKLIQTHQNGLGLFCFTGQKEDSLTEFKMSTDKKNIYDKLDVSNKFSMGQKNVTNIALMLALKKIETSSLDIFMIDDPCQSLDELNVASFVEIIKNEFSSTQVILSTHEDKIASYIKYKNDKAGKDMIMYNVQENLYNLSEQI